MRKRWDLMKFCGASLEEQPQQLLEGHLGLG
jgi:hypothetical protein